MNPSAAPAFAVHEDSVIFPTREKTPHRTHVLVVEDEALIRWAISETLTDAGYVVLEAPDGASALQTLRECPEDIAVILLDYRLPDSNDLTLFGNIRRLAPATSVVLMTAYGTPEVMAGAIAMGAFCVLPKPIDMHQIAPLVLRAEASRPH
jgi:DNA-binding NtrC family response regulator